LKILISGGTGFIGKNLIYKLLSIKNISILLITRNKKNNFKNDKIKYIYDDLANIKKYENLLIKFNPQVVFYLSWTGIPKFNISNCKKNINNSKKFAEITKKILNLKKVIILGSCLEYKKKFGECEESNYLENSNLFSKTKNEIYKIFKKQINRNVKFYWFRVFYVFGYPQRSGSLIPSIINAIKNNKNIKIRNLHAKNDYIYIEDLINIIIIFLKNNYDTGIYNLGSGKLTSNYDIYKFIKNKINKNYNKLIFKKYKNFDKNIWSSNYKIQKTIRKKINYDIYLGLQKTINKFVNN